MPKVKASAVRAGARYVLKNKAEWKPAEGGKFYPAEDVPKPRSRKFTAGKAKLRASITAGTVLILLSGRFRGKRVVFLKQLDSGLLLVTGPYAINGVPLRRVNQAYVIATSTKLDVSGVNTTAFNDAYFKGEKLAKTQDKAAQFLGLTKAAKAELSADKKAAQAVVDAAIKLSDAQKSYLKHRFALSNGDKPHEMKF